MLLGIGNVSFVEIVVPRQFEKMVGRGVRELYIQFFVQVSEMIMSLNLPGSAAVIQIANEICNIQAPPW